MAILGAHMSAAGGFHKAVERAAAEGCDCVQIFTTPPRQWPVKPSAGNAKPVRLGTKNNNQWRAKPITQDDVDQFQEKLNECQIGYPLSHSSYLINLASPDPELWKKSVNAFVIELRRADQLGIPYVVLHPGSHMGEGEAAGIRRVCRALNETHRRTRGITSQCLIETTAGQGTCLGWRFEHIASILDGVREPDRLGICFDTCHVFAAGYPLATERQYRETMRQLNRLCGCARVKAFHLNDSKRELGSRVDRHEHIGQGHLGTQSFRFLLEDRRFRSVPMYLETPKGEAKGKSCDSVNLCMLRSLSDS
jgi:deoxyribonuclease-4